MTIWEKEEAREGEAGKSWGCAWVSMTKVHNVHYETSQEHQCFAYLVYTTNKGHFFIYKQQK